MKLGARMIKTGIAVVLALYIGEWFNLEPVLFIVIAAVFATQPSIYRSFKYFLEQVQANAIGAVLGFIGVILIGNDPIVVGLIVIIVIIINLLLKLESSIGLAILTVIVVMEEPEGAIPRFMLIMIGIVLSILVNALFMPPNQERNLFSAYKSLNERVLLLLRNMSGGHFDEKSLRQEKLNITLEFKKAQELFQLYKEERTYRTHVRLQKPYKLVIYKEMLETLEIEMDIILAFRRNAQELFNDQIQESIQELTQYHELIFMKFEGKIKTKSKHERNRKVIEENDKLMQQLLKEDSIQYSTLDLLGVLSHLSELAKQLDHVDTMVTSFNRFHRTE
jgi:uncharacterized membrane protein YgaE (UPF0421/DUF939 family)